MSKSLSAAANPDWTWFMDEDADCSGLLSICPYRRNAVKPPSVRSPCRIMYAPKIETQM